MRDAIGGSLLLYIVVFFVGIVILFFAGILSYSKAYKAKNRIIEIIEVNENYNESVEEAIKDSLGSNQLAYQLGTCTEGNISGYTKETNNTGYKYCIYKSDKTFKSGVQYKVITYTQFQIPVIGNLLTFKVSGTTKVLNIDYNY